MKKYIKIYFWQIVSILFNFGSVFIVTPFISADKGLYGVYSIVIAAYFFISYADFGFLSAGMKYASEHYAQDDAKEEVRIVGFSGAVFLLFAVLYGLAVFLVSFNPSIIIKNGLNEGEHVVAKSLLQILALSCPLLVFQRIIQIIYGIRLKDYKFQRILIASNIIKLCSVFLFFGKGKYMIVEYFLFSQVCLLLAVIVGGVMMRRNLNYDVKLLIRSFRFSKSIYKKTRKLAFTSIWLTISWILYYELDPFAIARILGNTDVAVYAIGLTIITYFRSLFGILFTPFVARFNHFVGLQDKEGLQAFFLTVMALFLPLTVLPVIAVFLTTKNFILSWVGPGYTSSIAVAQILVLCYVFSFITYPSGILIMANERVNALYFTSALQPVIFWVGILFTYKYLGLEAFAYFKFLAFFLETVVYTVLILRFLDMSILKLLSKVVAPAVMPIAMVVVILLFLRSHLPIRMNKVDLAYYFVNIAWVVAAGVCCYYFTSKIFKEYTNKLITGFFAKRKIAVNDK